MVTTQDRLNIPPIHYFWQLVKDNIPEVKNFTPSQDSGVRSQELKRIVEEV